MANNSTRDELKKLADALRDPFRLRLLVAGISVAVMYFAVQQPLDAKMKVVSRQQRDLSSREAVAEEVFLLRSQLEKIDNRILQGGQGAATKFLMEQAAVAGVTLDKIDGQPPAKLGMLTGIRVRMNLSGSLEQLHAFIAGLESHQQLIRVDSISLLPPERDRAVPSLQLSLVLLGDKP